jgi:hypothetical protein
VAVVVRPTYSNSVFDTFFISHPVVYRPAVYVSLVKTKHIGIAVSVQPAIGTECGIV